MSALSLTLSSATSRTIRLPPAATVLELKLAAPPTLQCRFAA